MRQHRHDLLLVIRGLRNRRGNDQQARGVDRSLGVVGLIKAAAGDRHDAGCFVGQVDLVLRFGSGYRRLGRFATGRLAAFPGFLLTPCHPGFKFGLLFLEPDFRPCIDLGFGRSHGIESCLAAGNFRRQVHAVRHGGLVGLFGLCQQGFDFCRELDFQLLDMPV